MPPIGLHMVLAHRLATGVPDPCLRERPGPYLLGATAPDIRILTRQDRRSTHFFDLSVEEHQDSVEGFLRAHRELADPGQLNEDTRSFVAGYVSHLVMDEQYITRMYRQFFARHESMGGQIRANVMDRLLQFDMERAHGNDPELSREICQALSGTIENIQVGFIEPDTLAQWRDVANDVAERDMDWDRMRGMIANHLRRSGLEEDETLSGFLDSLPELLDETIAYVTEQELETFIERSETAAARAIERYLGCE